MQRYHSAHAPKIILPWRGCVRARERVCVLLMKIDGVPADRWRDVLFSARAPIFSDCGTTNRVSCFYFLLHLSAEFDFSVQALLCLRWQRAFHGSAKGGLQIFIHVSAQDMRGNMFIRKISYTRRQPWDNGDEVASQAFSQPQAKWTRFYALLFALRSLMWCRMLHASPVVKLKQLHSVH